jgi:hypothetical protein
LFAAWVTVWASAFVSSDCVDTDVGASSVVGGTFVDVDAFFTNTIPVSGVGSWDVCAHDLGGSVNWTISGWADHITYISWSSSGAVEGCSYGTWDGIDSWASNINDASITITFVVAKSMMATTSADGETTFFGTLGWGPGSSWVLDKVVDTSFSLFASLADSEETFFPPGFGLARLLVSLADSGVGAFFVGSSINAGVADKTA